jgi:serine/threonine protein phosphatase PrpC
MSEAVAPPPHAAGVCPTCGEAVDATARFCEGCGAALAPSVAAAVAEDPDRTVKAPPPAPPDAPAPAACTSCGATAGYDESGYCLACGHLGPSPRDHMVVAITGAAAVSDKGPNKTRNEDSMALLAVPGGGFVTAVCDGVSNVPRSAEASQAAADAAVAVLATGTDRPPAVFATAHQAALTKVVALAPVTEDGTEPPSCTFLAARWRPGEPLRVGWAGDCRAYWISGGAVSRLTVDHSWGTEQVRAGLLTQEQADADNRSHAITRWLGRDAPPEPPELVECDVGAGGLAVFCSDGLWNYLTDAGLAALVAAGTAVETSEELAERLVAHAIAAGGHDNITVVVAPIPATTTTTTAVVAEIPAGEAADEKGTM